MNTTLNNTEDQADLDILVKKYQNVLSNLDSVQLELQRRMVNLDCEDSVSIAMMILEYKTLQECKKQRRKTYEEFFAECVKLSSASSCNQIAKRVEKYLQQKSLKKRSLRDRITSYLKRK